MEMSLDEIITSTKRTRGGGRGRGGRSTRAGGRGGRGAGAGVRTAGGRPSGGSRRGVGAGAQQRFRTRPRPSGNADGVWTHDKFQDSNVGGIRKAGIRAVGGGGGGGGGSAKITISNLHYGVSDADIIELFGEVGNIRYASVHYDRSGRSMGKADVTFERRVDAQAAIQQYDGVPLDGRPMAISWANSAVATQQVSPRGSGLRQIQGKRINRTSGGGGGGGGFRGGRGGRGRGGGRGGRPGGSTKAPTAEELDAELDAYVSQNQK
ncbi:unnamed protein product [Allacma fusca]|uniref:RRM domain-containing protein n=1 Tax=Allacma fusca TaxID=39272 RepID=A0A8J2NV81_9HEXA|nr:unnamed protein product [Allacma fusca]